MNAVTNVAVGLNKFLFHQLFTLALIYLKDEDVTRVKVGHISPRVGAVFLFLTGKRKKKIIK